MNLRKTKLNLSLASLYSNYQGAKQHTGTVVCALAASSVMLSSPVLAQQATDAATAAPVAKPGALTDQIQSINITATKRKEDASKVPLSVSVIGGDELTAQHITDFADATSAEMMFGGISELVKRHRVVFVVTHDVALETRAGAEPRTPADVTRAVIADALLQDRLVVLQRLRRMCVEIIQAPAGKLAADTVTRYLSLKRRERL